MNLQISSRNVELTQETHDLIERRVQFALERFSEQIRSVTLTIQDINGDRGGEDKQCRMLVEFTSRGSVNAAHVASTIESAATQVIERLAHTVGREMDRRKSVAEGIRQSRQSASGEPT